jgi:hypothetical protein
MNDFCEQVALTWASAHAGWNEAEDPVMFGAQCALAALSCAAVLRKKSLLTERLERSHDQAAIATARLEPDAILREVSRFAADLVERERQGRQKAADSEEART